MRFKAKKDNNLPVQDLKLKKELQDALVSFFEEYGFENANYSLKHFSHVQQTKHEKDLSKHLAKSNFKE